MAKENPKSQNDFIHTTCLAVRSDVTTLLVTCFEKGDKALRIYQYALDDEENSLEIVSPDSLEGDPIRSIPESSTSNFATFAMFDESGPLKIIGAIAVTLEKDNGKTNTYTHIRNDLRARLEEESPGSTDGLMNDVARMSQLKQEMKMGGRAVFGKNLKKKAIDGLPN